MRMFLEMQEQLMVAYLATTGGASLRLAAAVPPEAALTLPAPPADVAAAAPPAVTETALEAAQPARPVAADAAPADGVTQLLLRLVGERTGYPPDMLGFDLDLEADLGIDAIKRIEILGAFRKELPPSLADHLDATMEDVFQAKSLQRILDLAHAAEAQLSVTGGAAAAVAPGPPLLWGSEAVDAKGAVRTLRKTVDLASDPYLDDHRIDGWPVMPLAFAAEYMAEAATLLGGAPVRALAGIRMLHGLVLRDAPLDLEIVLQPPVDGGAMVDVVLGGARRRVAYRATAEFGEVASVTPHRLPASAPAAPPVDIAMAYREWLFHGPRFQVVREILTMDRERVVARACATRPGDFYPPAAGGRWLLDPALVDGVAQLAWTWLVKQRDVPYLPSAIGRIARCGEAPIDGEVTVVIDIREGWDGTLLRFDFAVIDAAGQTRLVAESFEGVIDAGLNRLRGQWARSLLPAAAG